MARIDQLCAEFADYRDAHGLPHEGDALEMLMGLDLPADQRAWLSDFIQRWEAAEAADPAFHDRQAVTL